jgi:hypothetical protein
VAKAVPSPTSSRILAAARGCASSILFDLGADLVSLPENVTQAVGQSGQDRLGRGGARDCDGLFVESGQHLLDQAFAQAGRVLARDREELSAASLAQPGWTAAA